MDLNYLFLRQQVERTRAQAADTEGARAAHNELAQRYEAEIDKATGPNFRAPRSGTAEARNGRIGNAEARS
jgi:hypothetical protein